MSNEQKTLTNLEYSELIRKTIDNFTVRLKQDKTTITIPKLSGRWEKIPGSIFHVGFEIFFQIQGACIFQFPYQKHTILPGDIILVPPGMPHQEKALPHEGKEFRNMAYMISTNWATVHIAECPNIKDKPKYVPSPIFLERMSKNCAPLLYQILAAITSDQENSVDNVHILHNQLMIAYLLKTRHELGSTTDKNLWQVGGDDELDKKHYKITLAKRYIDAHMLSSTVSVADLAHAVKCSPNYLSHLFRQVTGETIKDYTNRQKLEYARTLIDTTPLNISEIAWSCGYQDPSYFTKIFKRQFGTKPAELRK